MRVYNNTNHQNLPKALWSVIISTLLSLGALSQVQAAPTYTAGIEPGFPPFSYQSQGKAKGMAPDIIRAIAKKEGFNVKFVALPFPSLIPALSAGKLQLIADGLSVTKVRAKRIDYTLPWVESNDVIVAPNKTNLNVFTAVVGGHTLGIQGGSSQEGWVNANLKNTNLNVHLRDYSSYVSMITDMLDGRIGAADIPETTALEMINKGRPIKIIGKIYIHNPVAFAVRKGDPNKLLAKLNKGLVAISKDGELAAIIHKYVPGLPVPTIPSRHLPSFVNTYHNPIPGVGSNG